MEDLTPDRVKAQCEKDKKVYDRYMALKAIPGSGKIKICQRLMAEFEIGSISTIYQIIKRVESKKELNLEYNEAN